MTLQVEEAGTASVVRRALDILLSYLLQLTWFGQVPGTVPTMGAALITITIVFEGWRKLKKKKKEGGEQKALDKMDQGGGEFYSEISA